MHGTVARALYFGLQRMRGEPVAAALADVRASEFLPPDELRALQARRLLAQLRFAAREVPHYRETLAPLAGDLERARTWDDLDRVMQRIPVLAKGAVTETPARFRADGAGTLSTYPAKTSGSSGTPVSFPCDKRAWAYRSALLYRCLESFGVRVGEPYAYFFRLHWSRSSRFQVGIRDRVLNRVRISAYEIGPERFDDHLRALRRWRPTHIIGYPSAVYDFAVMLRDREIEPSVFRLKAIFVQAEPLREHQRAVIEAAFGVPCVNTYGSVEGGFGAFECPARSLHVAVESTWLERRPEHGDALVTDMFLRAFPMIRYAVGDEIVLRDGACDCGRAHPRLASIEGRSGDPITLPTGRRINANLPSYIFKNVSAAGLIRRYRFVQTPEDTVDLLLVVSGRFDDRHRAEVERETRTALGEDLPLTVRLVDALPTLANAKHRDYVVADRKP